MPPSVSQVSDTSLIYDVGPNESFSTAVVQAVATATESDPVSDAAADGAAAMPPLYEAVEPDALDSLFGAATESTPASVTFRYHDCSVTVDSRGHVRVDPLAN